MFGWVGVNSPIAAAVHGQIGLPVAIEVQRPQNYRALHRALEDACHHGSVLRNDFAREANIHREEPHGDWMRQGQARFTPGASYQNSILVEDFYKRTKLAMVPALSFT